LKLPVSTHRRQQAAQLGPGQCSLPAYYGRATYYDHIQTRQRRFMVPKRFANEPLARVPVYRPPYKFARGHYPEARHVAFVGARTDNEVSAGGDLALPEHPLERLAPGELTCAAAR
jgi:hypothetical protein